MCKASTRLPSALLGLLCAALVLNLLGAPFPSVQAAPRPNVVVIMTDDQHLESLRVMPKTSGLLGGTEGTTFSNFFVSQSLCCPSRATFLTGQYTHNHGVWPNKPPNGGHTKLDHTNTLAVWLQNAGYHTVHIGKSLNGYGGINPTGVPPGWSHWQGLVHPPNRMYDYTINDNGTLVPYGNAPADYQTDVLADRAVAVITERAGTSQPFFLSIAPLAPHGEGKDVLLPGSPNPRPAPRHAGRFAFEPLPMPPSFNEADVSDKPWNIRQKSLLSPAEISAITIRYRDELTSLLAVDDLVERVVNALNATGQLANTVLFFTSDNGFFHGEHRIPSQKHRVYEEAIHMPPLVRGGGFPAGVTTTQQVANIDLAPTIVALSGAIPGRVLDGRPLLPLALNSSLGRGRDLLIATGHVDRTSYRIQAIRTERYLYSDYGNGEMELYDLQSDPFQLTSLHTDPAFNTIKAQLQPRLDLLRDCTGTGCSRGSN
jgi:N-acetylglucosamine-6-sulfatase